MSPKPWPGAGEPSSKPRSQKRAQRNRGNDKGGDHYSPMVPILITNMTAWHGSGPDRAELLSYCTRHMAAARITKNILEPPLSGKRRFQFPNNTTYTKALECPLCQTLRQRQSRQYHCHDGRARSQRSKQHGEAQMNHLLFKLTRAHGSGKPAKLFWNSTGGELSGTFGRLAMNCQTCVSSIDNSKTSPYAGIGYDCPWRFCVKDGCKLTCHHSPVKFSGNLDRSDAPSISNHVSTLTRWC